MQIKIILDDKEVKAMVDKINRRPYDKIKIQEAGRKIIKAYEQFERIKKQNNPSPEQIDIYDIQKIFGGKII